MKFDYGDEVVAKIASKGGIVVEKECVVVSITPVESVEQAIHFKCPVGTVLYTVEFGDGTDVQVSEGDLRPID
jgi:hypothetical protein